MLHFVLVALSILACTGTPDKTGEGFGPGNGDVAMPPPAPPPTAPPADHDNDFKTGPIIPPVNFASGSTEVEPAELKSVEKASEIAKNGNWKVLLVCLADESGDPAMNKQLTEKRCQVVAHELNTFGIPDTQIIRHAIGERLATDTNNVRQRKVEFVFYQAAAGMSAEEIAKRSRVLEADYHGREDEPREGKEGKGSRDGKSKQH